MNELLDLVLEETKDQDGQSRRTRAQASSSTIRTGRANPSLIEKLPVDAYGAEVPLQQVAGFSVPEARTLVVSPFDKNADGRHREGDPQQRPGVEPLQRRHRDPPSRSRSSTRSAARSW